METLIIRALALVAFALVAGHLGWFLRGRRITRPAPRSPARARQRRSAAKPRTLSGGATLALVLALSATAPAICGDCDGDGAVTILDALRASQVAAGIAIPTLADLPCDVAAPIQSTCDGTALPVITIADALVLAQAATGSGSVLACACP